MQCVEVFMGGLQRRVTSTECIQCFCEMPDAEFDIILVGCLIWTILEKDVGMLSLELQKELEAQTRMRAARADNNFN